MAVVNSLVPANLNLFFFTYPHWFPRRRQRSSGIGCTCSLLVVAWSRRFGRFLVPREVRKGGISDNFLTFGRPAECLPSGTLMLFHWGLLFNKIQGISNNQEPDLIVNVSMAPEINHIVRQQPQWTVLLEIYVLSNSRNAYSNSTSRAEASVLSWTLLNLS